MISKFFFNKTIFDFILITELDLFKLLVSNINIIKTYLNIANLIAFMQINFKFYYNRKYWSISLIIKNYALFQFYKSYNILFTLN